LLLLLLDPSTPKENQTNIKRKNLAMFLSSILLRITTFYIKCHHCSITHIHQKHSDTTHTHTHTQPKSPNNKNKKTPKTTKHCRSRNHHNSAISNNLQETKHTYTNYI
jgi:hypothetical protein